jgi:hypothetical protein
MALVEVKVPDIGDFKDVAVIELLVKPGDTVAADQSLLTVESDKASMEIPSSHAGVVKELKVAAGRQGRRRQPDPGAGNGGRPRSGCCARSAGCRTATRAPRHGRSVADDRPRSRSSCPTSVTSTRWP